MKKNKNRNAYLNFFIIEVKSDLLDVAEEVVSNFCVVVFFAMVEFVKIKVVELVLELFLTVIVEVIWFNLLVSLIIVVLSDVRIVLEPVVEMSVLFDEIEDVRTFDSVNDDDDVDEDVSMRVILVLIKLIIDLLVTGFSELFSNVGE